MRRKHIDSCIDRLLVKRLEVLCGLTILARDIVRNKNNVLVLCGSMFFFFPEVVHNQMFVKPKVIYKLLHIFAVCLPFEHLTVAMINTCVSAVAHSLTWHDYHMTIT